MATVLYYMTTVKNTFSHVGKTNRLVFQILQNTQEIWKLKCLVAKPCAQRTFIYEERIKLIPLCGSPFKKDQCMFIFSPSYSKKIY